MRRGESRPLKEERELAAKPKTPAPKKDSAPKAEPVRRRASPAKKPKSASVEAAPAQTGPDLAQLARKSLEDSKAENIVAIDVAGRTSLADSMVVATGRSTTHVGAIADHLLKAWKAAGLRAPRVEGLPHCDWVLIDAGDVIVHVFKPDVRQFYNLEKMWGDDRPRERAAKA